MVRLSERERLARTVREIGDRRDLIKKIKRGQVKQPPPPGVKVTFAKPAWPAEFDDEIPSFGAAIEGLE